MKPPLYDISRRQIKPDAIERRVRAMYEDARKVTGVEQSVSSVANRLRVSDAYIREVLGLRTVNK